MTLVVTKPKVVVRKIFALSTTVILLVANINNPTARAQTPNSSITSEDVQPPLENVASKSFDQLLDSALNHYDQGAYLKAITNFEAAYALRARPELVYNIARAYEKALKPEQSIKTYERFIRLPGTTAELRTKALNALTALRAERHARTRAQDKPPSESLPPKSTQEPPATNLPTPVSSSAVTTFKPSPRPNRTLEILLMSGGVAIAGAGAVMGLLALDAQSELDRAKSTNQPQSIQLDLAERTDRRAIIADVLYAAGAVSALTGLIVYIARDTGPELSITPVGQNDGAGVMLRGRF